MLLATLVVLGCLGLLEAGSSVIYFYSVPQAARTAVEAALGLGDAQATRSMRFRPHPYFGYTANPDYVTAEGQRLHEEPGIRAQDAVLRERRAGSLRMVAIGGSTTFGLHVVDPKAVWPAMLEAELRRRLGSDIEVINAGVPSYTTFELLGVASMWLPEWRPDFVLIHCGLNDAFAVGFPDEGGLDNTSFRHHWWAPETPQFAKLLMHRSYAARLLGMRVFTPSGFGMGDLNAVTQYQRPPDEEVRANVATATGKYYRRNLGTLIALVRHAGAVPVLLNEPLNPVKESGQGVFYDAVTEAIHRNNAITGDIAREQGLLLVDLYARMRDPADFTDACHETEQGMRLKAMTAAAALEPLVASELARRR